MMDGHIDFSANPRLISQEDYREWTKKLHPQKHDVVLSRRCNPGETAIVKENSQFVLGQNLVILRVEGNQIELPYLRWMVQGPFWWSEVERYINVGAVFNSLRCADIPNFRLPLPPLAEQKAIAHILGSLDDKIELNRQMNATLEGMAQALFQSWFVDFDPVIDKALAAGNDIPEPLQARARRRAALGERRKALPPEVMALFPDRFVETEEMGWVPEGWEVSILGKLIQVKHGYAFQGEDFSDVPTSEVLLTPGNFRVGGGFKADKLKYYKGEVVQDHILEKGDLIVTMTDLSKEGDTLGYPAVVPNIEGLRFHHNQRLGKVIILDRRVNSSFLYQCLCLATYRNEILATATGTTVRHTSPSKIQAFSVLFSGGQIEAQFEVLTAPMQDKIDTNNLTIATLTQLRDTLLPKLISGELRVGDVPVPQTE